MSKKNLRDEVYEILVASGYQVGGREGDAVRHLVEFIEARQDVLAGIRSRRVTDHLRLVATSKMVLARALRERGEDTRALMEECSASGLHIAIATIEGSTPMQIEEELELEIAVS